MKIHILAAIFCSLFTCMITVHAMDGQQSTVAPQTVSANQLTPEDREFEEQLLAFLKNNYSSLALPMSLIQLIAFITTPRDQIEKLLSWISSHHQPGEFLTQLLQGFETRCADDLAFLEFVIQAIKVQPEIYKQMVRRLSKRANAVDHSGQTPLHMAAYRGHIGLVQALLAAEANVHAMTRFGQTPLHMAAIKGHIDVVQALLAAGANVDAVDQRGKTPLHSAAEEGHIGVLQALIAAGANVDAVDQWGQTPLHSAAKEGHIGVVQALIAAKANVDAMDQLLEQAPLHIAAIQGHIGVLQALIAAGANVNTVDDHGKTPLHIAAGKGHIDVVQALIAAGANVDAVDQLKRTPLHMAATEGHIGVVQALIAAEANVDGCRPTPLDIALIYRNQQIIDFLTPPPVTTLVTRPGTAVQPQPDAVPTPTPSTHGSAGNAGASGSFTS